MPCACNRCAKIQSGVGCILIVVGGIVILASYLGASASFDIETTGGGNSVQVNLDNEDCGHSLYIRASDPCEGDWFSMTTPTISAVHVATGTAADVSGGCSAIETDSEVHWEAAHDPPLRGVGSFSAADDPNSPCDSTAHCDNDDHANGWCTPRCRKLTGSYQVTSSTSIWVLDACEELAEALTGIAAIIIMVYVCVAIFLVGGIFFCVACCCCCQGPDQPKVPPPQGQVIGQPVAVATPAEGQA